jgi:prolyl 4-hydroxylase
MRTANISFCHSFSDIRISRLQRMDFYIPQEYFETLQVFYQADEAEDDMYERQDYDALPLQNPEYQCLLDQRQNIANTAKKFKGITYYYKSPIMEDIYPELAKEYLLGGGSKMSRQRKLQQPPLVFTGFAAKFVNLSPKPVLLYWDGKGGREDAKKLVGEIAPFESLGTATMPGQSFHITPVYDSSTALQRWVVSADMALAYYEPMTPQEMHPTLLQENPAAFGKYQRQLINQAFARDYLIASQRAWLAHFPRRFPMHSMHPAIYIGQEHAVGDFKLKVVSVTPRVLVIDNFLSPEECQAIIQLAKKQTLEHSTLYNGASAKLSRDLSTRSSSNTWLSRDTDDLTEKVYQQAAQVMSIDPDLFQKFHETSARHNSIAESLQVVRYKENGEEYQPHHDFVYPSINHRYQPTRFATLLLYLNDVPKGGETRFPRAVNNHNAEGLEIQPKVGQAVLFYNMLEDGNVDDLSQHGSNPTDGYEKWLANLWAWDPVID